ncbi:MAG: type II toxin-antitoxin system VapC family toxin [Nocardioides sp.]
MPVVDASVVVDWVAPDADTDGPAMRALDELVGGEPVLAPRLMLEEVANALLTGIRRARWSGTDADQAFSRLRELPVEMVDMPSDLDRAWELSRRYDEHPIYDLLYLALARRVDRPLWTADRRMADRVRSSGIRVIG